MPKRTPEIVVNHLNVVYFLGMSNEVRALSDINMKIYPGEFIIFFGPSGCGKSTLLYSISGLEKKAEGEILIKGDDLFTLNTDQRAHFHQSTIGMIFQAYHLIPSLSILSNVALPQMAMNGSKRSRETRASELLEHFGVGKQMHKLPSELSGGQQQRVAICRSLMNDPDIIFADEPVGNLDSKSSEDVMKLLRELNEKEGKTVILVTHDPSHLHIANRIFYMRDGKVVDTKSNTEEERKRSVVKSLARSELRMQSFQHWAKTFSAEDFESEQDMQSALKAQEIVSEVLMHMTVDELFTLEQTVQQVLLGVKDGEEAIYNVLHDPIAKGGMGMNARKAKSLSNKMIKLTTEIKKISHIKKRKTQKEKQTVLELQAEEMRRYMLDSLSITLPSTKSIPVVDSVVFERIIGKVERKDVQEALDLPLKDGGAGLDRRIARSFARFLETLVTRTEELREEHQSQES